MNNNHDKIEELCDILLDYVLEEMELAENRDDDDCWNSLNNLRESMDKVFEGNLNKLICTELMEYLNEVIANEDYTDEYSKNCVDAIYDLYNDCDKLLKEGIYA